MTRPRRGTQQQVAKEANVSQALVSKVLNGAEVQLRDETREKILAIAQRLGYAPRAKSRQPAPGKVLAYIQPLILKDAHREEWIYGAYEEFFQRVHSSLLKTAYEKGYALVARPYAEPLELKRWLVEWDVDGVIWHSRDIELLEWIADRYPTVQINRHDIIHADAVSSNQEEVVLLAMDHLRENGHERIAFQPLMPRNDRLWKMRERAFEDYISRYQLPVMEVPLSTTDDGDYDQLIDRLIQAPEECPTAIVLSDHQALRLIKRIGARAPELLGVISLVGIDNVTACDFVSPSLTSVDPCMDELARSAIVTLLERIANPDINYRKLLISPKLVDRSSVINLRKGSKKLSVKRPQTTSPAIQTEQTA